MTVHGPLLQFAALAAFDRSRHTKAGVAVQRKMRFFPIRAEPEPQQTLPTKAARRAAQPRDSALIAGHALAGRRKPAKVRPTEPTHVDDLG